MPAVYNADADEDVLTIDSADLTFNQNTKFDEIDEELFHMQLFLIFWIMYVTV